MSNKWELEAAAAVDAVREAMVICRGVQTRLVRPETLEKKDKSPVTVADFASQAVVCAHLAHAFADDPIVGEEGTGELRTSEQDAIRGAVVREVAGLRGGIGAGQSEAAILSWIDRGGSVGTGKVGRYWTLDPIDGTKGFLRGEQYAVALALIEDGQIVVGALGCPNYAGGSVYVATRGGGAFRVSDAWGESGPAKPQAARVRVADVVDARAARICESVESAHSDQSQAATIAHLLGITSEPLRMDSQVKYAAVASGEASIYLRLPTRKDYRECIWDHAAGVLVVQEAGGTASDVDGKPLDMTVGRKMENNRGVVATGGKIQDAVLAAVKAAGV